MSTPLEEAYLEKVEAIVRDLAACDPIVHVPTDWGDSSSYECGLCNVAIEFGAAQAYAEEDRRTDGHGNFPHADTCPWRRAKELTT